MLIPKENEVIKKSVNEVPIAQIWFWSKEWQEMEKKATEDEKNGNTTIFEDDEEAIKWLKS
jgi:hypothetical protein